MEDVDGRLSVQHGTGKYTTRVDSIICHPLEPKNVSIILNNSLYNFANLDLKKDNFLHEIHKLSKAHIIGLFIYHFTITKILFQITMYGGWLCLVAIRR